MNLHFIPDNGFLNSFIDIAEKISPDNNKYLIVDGVTPLSLPEKKKIKSDKAFAVKYNSASFHKHIGDVKLYDKVFIHFLTDTSCDFILKHYDSDLKFYWMFWGADLYKPLKKFAPIIYDQKSLSYYNAHTTFNKTGNSVLDFLKYSKRKLSGNYFLKKELALRTHAIKRIDFFCHYNELDHELLNQYFPNNSKFKPFFYFEYDYSELKIEKTSSNVKWKNELKIKSNTIIQVGHSSSLSNNHLEVLEQIANQPRIDFDLVVPLSYGDLNYRETVIQKGIELFRDAFHPITQYYSKEDYLDLLYSIDLCIMNHKRTEAAGNVFMMLAMGKKVILNSDSNLKSFLLKNGVSLFDLNEISTGVNSNYMITNRTFIIDFFSSANAYRFVFELLK